MGKAGASEPSTVGDWNGEVQGKAEITANILLVGNRGKKRD